VPAALGPAAVDLGPLSPLATDPRVTDVLVNGPDQVWIDRGLGLERAPSRFPDDEAVRGLAVRLAAAAGRRLDAGAPFTDVALAGGIRLHAVLPPISPEATCLSLRFPRRRPLTLAELMARGRVPTVLAATLDAIIAARLAGLVSGGAGTGKTTLLGAMLGRVSPAERILIIEDTVELAVDHPHVLRLVGRAANIEGSGEITLAALVRQALRMRPDRIVVGEVRGGEVVDLLTALNTGHEGGMCTVHANTAADAPARVEALGAMAGLERAALHSQLAAAIQVVVHVGRGPDGVRHLDTIGVAHRAEDGAVVVLDALRLTRRTPPLAPSEPGRHSTGLTESEAVAAASVHISSGPGWPHLRRLLAERGIDPPDPGSPRRPGGPRPSAPPAADLFQGPSALAAAAAVPRRPAGEAGEAGSWIPDSPIGAWR